MDESARIAVDVLLEDFKARWQELLNIESEINTWAITYLTAMFLSIAWILGQKNGQIIATLFKEQRILILSIAVVNASYMLMLSAKDYRLQQNALYIYEVLAPRISDISGESFNTWEEWRRQNTLSWGRNLYNILITLPTVAISGFILIRYAINEQPLHEGQRLALRSIYWDGVVLFNLLALVVAISYSYKVNRSWQAAIQRHDSQTQHLTTLRVSSRAKVLSRAAIRALEKAVSGTEVGTDLATYSALVTDANVQIHEALILLPEGDLKREIESSLKALLDGKRAWEMSLRNADHLPTKDAQVRAWIKAYSIDETRTSPAQNIPRDLILQAIWKAARSHTNNATLRLTELR